MIIIPIFILVLLILIKLQKGAFAAFLVLVATKSIMDAFWNIKFGSLSILAIQGVLIPVLFLSVFKSIKFFPKQWMLTAKIYVVALSFGLVWVVTVLPIVFVETIILNINIFIGFLLIPILVKDRKGLKQLLYALMISGIFPILVSLYQYQTGVIFQERATVGIVRYVGFYHDAFPVRFYGLMTLMSVLLYNHAFVIKSLFLKIGIGFLTLGALFSIYLVVSKAGVGILGLWIVLILLFSKSSLRQGLSLVVFGAVIILIFGDAFFDNIEQLFSKEVGYQSGDVKDARYTLAGRGYIWEDYWKFWINAQSTFFQWVGDGINRPVHNEFFRILLVNGIIGLLLFLGFLVINIRNVFKMHKNIRVFAIMLLGMYIIDCIGLVPGVYYYYNILVWGIFGTLLLSPHLFIKGQNN